MTAEEIAPDLVRFFLGEPPDDDLMGFINQTRRATGVLGLLHDLISSAVNKAIAESFGEG